MIGLTNAKIKKLDKLYLYKEGDECIDITGGWEQKGYIRTLTGCEFTKNSDSMYLYSSQGTARTISCGIGNKVDTLDYQSIHFDVTPANDGTSRNNQIILCPILITSSSKTSAFGASGTFYQYEMRALSGRQEIVIDRASWEAINLNSFYVAFCEDSWSSAGGVTVHNIWLE